MTPRGGGGVFEGGGAALTGTWRALKAKGITDVNVVGFFGDGGTYDIGLQGISAAAERNENIWVITKDNEAYMNTGNQRSSATPLYAMTSTTPVGSEVKGKQMGKKNIPMIFAAHHVPFVGTASVGYRSAVQTGIWPLYEITDGEKFKLTYKPRELKPVAEYYKTQARFRHVTDEQLEGIQEDTAKNWEKLLKSDELGQLLV
jgi:pyruvate/2-oxoacid:ferredoxin oxidoreductase beta subunit